MIRLFIICGGLFWASAAAFAVSRIGGGTLSNDEMLFSTVEPKNFRATIMLANGDLRLDGGLVALPNGILAPQSLQVFMLPNARPDLIGANDRKEVIAIFVDREGWLRRDHHEPCVEWFEKVVNQSLTTTLLWGSGRGVIFTGLDGVAARQAIEDMATHLSVGSCGWK